MPKIAHLDHAALAIAALAWMYVAYKLGWACPQFARDHPLDKVSGFSCNASALGYFAKMLVVPVLLGAAGFLRASMGAKVALFILVLLPLLAVAPFLA